VYETPRNRSSWSSFIVAKPADSGVPKTVHGILIAGVSAIFLESCTKFYGRDPSTKPQPTGGIHPQPRKLFVVRFVKLPRVVAGGSGAARGGEASTSMGERPKIM